MQNKQVFSTGYKPMRKRALFITRPDQTGAAEDAAIKYANSNGCSLHVLFVLTSDLFHYGKNDWVVPGYARSQFLFHIRYELLRHAEEREVSMREKAGACGVEISFSMAETEVFEDSVLREASSGYERIFMNWEKKKFFPLFGGKTLANLLQRKGIENVVAC
jgi:hypothetical protein